MPDIAFRTLPIGSNLAIFAAAAVVVWMAGTRLAGYVGEIGHRTRLSQAFLGMVFLGVATSLPEIAATVSGSIIGNSQLVIGNLLGGVALQTTLLPIVDLAVPRALTRVSATPAVLFQGVMQILLLSMVVAGAAAGEPLAWLGVGLTPALLLAGYIVTVQVAGTRKYLPRWRPTTSVEHREEPEATDVVNGMADAPNRSLYVRGLVAAIVILFGGWALAVTGEALADQTGLGASFVGVALVAASTSLPELSTTLAAVRSGHHEMAVSNILGTNCLTIALFMVGDVAYREAPILAEIDRSGMLAAAVSLVITSLLLLGLLERRRETIGRMGLDSVAILVAYGAGLAVLFHLR
jgi:cation:H+ antiporter